MSGEFYQWPLMQELIQLGIGYCTLSQMYDTLYFRITVFSIVVLNLSVFHTDERKILDARHVYHEHVHILFLSGVKPVMLVYRVQFSMYY